MNQISSIKYQPIYFVMNGLASEDKDSPTSFTALNITLYDVFVTNPLITIGPANCDTSTQVEPAFNEYL